MRPITPEEMLDLSAYERDRDAIRERAMAARALRRVTIAAHGTLMFECRETVRYQIQEMLRAENIESPEAVAYEIETYSDLLPGPHELAATLFLEFESANERAAWLARLRDLEHPLYLVIEDEEIPAVFDPRQMDPNRVSAVQFVRFPLSPLARRHLKQGARTRILLFHPRYGPDAGPSYPLSTEVPAETLAALWADLEEASQ